MTVPKSARDCRAILDAALAKYQADGWWIENRTDFQATIKKRERGRWEQLVELFGGSQHLPPWEVELVFTHVRVVTVDDHGTVVVRKATGEPLSGLEIVRRSSAGNT